MPLPSRSGAALGVADNCGGVEHTPSDAIRARPVAAQQAAGSATGAAVAAAVHQTSAAAIGHGHRGPAQQNYTVRVKNIAIAAGRTEDAALGLGQIEPPNAPRSRARGSTGIDFRSAVATSQCIHPVLRLKAEGLAQLNGPINGSYETCGGATRWRSPPPGRRGLKGVDTDRGWTANGTWRIEGRFPGGSVNRTLGCETGTADTCASNGPGGG